MDKVINLKGLNGVYLFADTFQDNDLFNELDKFKYINSKYNTNNKIISSRNNTNNKIIGSNDISKSNSSETKSEISINNEIISGKKYSISFDLNFTISGSNNPIDINFYVDIGSNKVPLNITDTSQIETIENYNITGDTDTLNIFNGSSYNYSINLNAENIIAGKTKDFKIIIEYSKLSGGKNDIKFNFTLDPKTININTYGISVYNVDKSSTKKINGKFNILNRSKEFVYYNSITYKSINLRNNNYYSKKDISVNILPSNMDKDDDSFNYNYEIIFKNNKIGDLTIVVPHKYKNGNNTKMYPFEYLNMFAIYSVYHPENIPLSNYLSSQYYGQSNIKPNIKKGYIDINFEIKIYTNALLTNFITDIITITLPLINDKDYSGTNEKPLMFRPSDFDMEFTTRPLIF
jgi:hypothetical protein